jgi:hypothetical protein
LWTPFSCGGAGCSTLFTGARPPLSGAGSSLVRALALPDDGAARNPEHTRNLANSCGVGINVMPLQAMIESEARFTLTSTTERMNGR